MNAVVGVAMAKVRRRRLQSAVVAVVALLAAGTGVMALNLQTLTDAPYDRAFDAHAGAHLTMEFAPGLTAAQLQPTTRVAAVAATGGPWPQVAISADAAGTCGGAKSPGAGPVGPGGACGVRRLDGILLVGRSSPGGLVDRLDIVAGHWPNAANEVAVRQLFAENLGLVVGDAITATEAPGAPLLRVTAIVAGVDQDVDGWMRPVDIAGLATAKQLPDLRMEYRLHVAVTTGEVSSARAEITAASPAHSVEGAVSWLDVKRQADLTVEVMSPFLLAFSLLAVGAVVLIVINVVSGAVTAGRRDIGVMKTIGVTPAEVTGIHILAMAIPAVIGTAVGLPLGVLASQPLLAKSAEAFNLPYEFGTSAVGVILAGAATLAAVALAATIPGWRAGSTNTADALSAPLGARAGVSARLWQRLAAIPFPRPLALGLADTVVRPTRSAVTLVAVLVGVASVVFATGLTASLEAVKAGSAGPANAQISAVVAPNVDAPQTLATLHGLSGVGRISEAEDLSAVIPGVSRGSRVDAWSGATTWLGYQLVQGRWFAGPNEVVISSELQLMTGLHLGDQLTVYVGTSTLRPAIVGVIFDPGNPARVNLDARTLVGSTGQSDVFTNVFIAVTAGAQPDTVAAAADQVDGVQAEVIGANQDDTAYLIIEGVLFALTAIVAAVSALGVFNTVVLSTRERQRHLAILKAIGMEPRQTMVMVLTSTIAIGLVGGALAIPAGIALHRTILRAMAGIAGTEIPSSFYSVYSWQALPLLALSGVAIAALGAGIPARWIARRSVSEALGAE